MEALPPLARVLRYGNVRGTDATAVGEVVDGIVARIAVGLSAAAASLDDDAAVRFTALVDGVHGAIALLDDPDDRATWRGALQRLLERPDLHGLVAGRVTRLLLDEGTLSSAEGTRRMQLALSRGAEPAAGAAWVEGFLQDSGTILLHDADLFAALDRWVLEMPGRGVRCCVAAAPADDLDVRDGRATIDRRAGARRPGRRARPAWRRTGRGRPRRCTVAPGPADPRAILGVEVPA